MRVAVVAPKVNLATGGGSHQSLLLYTRGLRELGVDVAVHALVAPPAAERAAFTAAGVPLAPLPGAGVVAQARALGAMPADVLLVDAPLALAHVVKRRFPGRRVAAHLNTLSGFCTNVERQQDGCWLRCRHVDRVRHHPGGPLRRARYLLAGPWRVAALRRGFASLDGCVFASPPTRDAYRIYRLDPARCHVVPECIDVDRLRRFRAAEFGSTADGPTILFVGLLAPYKGLRLLFEALRRLPGPWRVRIYGDGADRERVHAFAAEFPGRVDFRGYVANDALFAELDGGDFLFVHPCLWFEALGRSVLECMALGIPVVVPDVGGPAWTVTDGVTGRHYRHRDPAALARALAEAVACPEETRALARAGREAVAAFDYRVVAAAWRGALARIAGQGDARG